ncbi:hypothetical protein CAPTEDRAFT_99849 [Capitella teleta]|uniref:RUN domain-containing protein n=1 Tax=Capitella teleta TaxID=283909 RepID=R7UJX4_CAPTE|nr:hypothetical protein CAPTEDRAFT_99849 [Capitella teleta]|eukprot:ELU06500.1 hypothetical protein CAPTEDRAFT_99849 [Capitella teleta]
MHSLHSSSVQFFSHRCAVKSLIDASCDRPINEESEEVCNFLAVLEHVFSHRLKATAWMSSSEPRRFWEFVKSACKSVPHNSICNIEQMDCPKTAQGKGRAWLQLSLMEKRLAEYMNEMLMQTRMLRQFYQPGALMLSEDAGLISGLLIGLNVLDFSFDVRSQNLDFIGIPVLDFTPYLKFEQQYRRIIFIELILMSFCP